MKRKVLAAVLMSIFVLAGCQNQEEAGSNEAAEVNVITEETSGIAETTAESADDNTETGTNEAAEVNVVTEETSGIAETTVESADDNTETDTEACDEVIDEAVDSVVDYQAFVGDYQDSVSQRATAVITENEDMSSAHIEISWANSADSSSLWTMDVTYEDEKLVYSNGEKFVITYDENGSEEKLGEFIEMYGYFEWDGITGNISWTGADEEICQSCVFEKIS